MTADKLAAEPSRQLRPSKDIQSAAADITATTPKNHGAIDLSFSEKLSEIGTWQRLLKEFMQKSGKLNDLISHFTQKFVQVGERRNFALTVLTDMAWTILILTWEAILQGELPIISVGEMGFKERYDNLITQHQLCRAEWLKEISEMRDRRREKRYGLWFNDACKMKEEEVFRYLPEDALIGEETKEYFLLAVEEGVKVAFARTSETNLAEQLMMAERRLEATVAESEDLKYRVQELQATIAERNAQKVKDHAYLKEDLKKAHRQQMTLHKQVEALTERLMDREATGGEMKRVQSRRTSTQSRASGAGDRDDNITAEEVKHLRDNVRRLTSKFMQIDSEAEASPTPQSPSSVEPTARQRLSVVIADRVEVDDLELGEDDPKQLLEAQSGQSAAGGVRKRSKTSNPKASAKKSPSRRGSVAIQEPPKEVEPEPPSPEPPQQDSSPLVSQVRVREVRARENKMKQEKEDLEKRLEQTSQEKEALQREKNELEEKLQAYQWAELAPTMDEKTPKTPKAPVLDFAAIEREDKLLAENQLLMQKLADATSVKQSLEVAMQELRARVEELKRLLEEKNRAERFSSEANASAQHPKLPAARTAETAPMAESTGAPVVGRSSSGQSLRHSSEASGGRSRTPSEGDNRITAPAASAPKGPASSAKAPTMSRAPSTGNAQGTQGTSMSRTASAGASQAPTMSRAPSTGNAQSTAGPSMSRTASAGASQGGASMSRAHSYGSGTQSQQMGRVSSAGSIRQAQPMTRAHSSGGTGTRTLSSHSKKAGGMKPLALQTEGLDHEELEAIPQPQLVNLIQEPLVGDLPRSPPSARSTNLQPGVFSPQCSRPPSARMAPATAAVMQAMGQVCRSAGQGSHIGSPQASQSLGGYRAAVAGEHDPQDFFPSFLDEEELRRMVAEIRTYGSDGILAKLRRGVGSRRPLSEHEADATIAHLERLVRICGTSALVVHASGHHAQEDPHADAIVLSEKTQSASKHHPQQPAAVGHEMLQAEKQEKPQQRQAQRPPQLQTAFVEDMLVAQHVQCVQRPTSPHTAHRQAVEAAAAAEPGSSSASPRNLTAEAPQVKLTEQQSQQSLSRASSKASGESLAPQPRPPSITSIQQVAPPPGEQQQQGRMASRQPSMQLEQPPAQGLQATAFQLKESLQIKELRQSQFELQEENKALQQQVLDLQEQIALLRQQLQSNRQLQRSKSKHVGLEDRSLSPSSPKLMCQSQHMLLTPRHAAPTITVPTDEGDSPPVHQHQRPSRCSSRGLDATETPRRASSAGSCDGNDSPVLPLQTRARPRFVSDSVAQSSLAVPLEEPRTAVAPIKVPPLATLPAAALLPPAGGATPAIPSKAVLEGPAEQESPGTGTATGNRKGSRESIASRRESKPESTASRRESKPESRASRRESKPESTASRRESKPESTASRKESRTESIASRKESKPESVPDRTRSHSTGLDDEKSVEADRPESERSEPQLALVIPTPEEPQSENPPKSTAAAAAGGAAARELPRLSMESSSQAAALQQPNRTQPEDAPVTLSRPALVRRQSSSASCPALPSSPALQSDNRTDESLLPAVTRRGSGAGSTSSPAAARKRPTTASGVMHQQTSGRVLFEADSSPPALMLDMVHSGPPQASASPKKGGKSKSTRTPITVRIEPMIPTRPATAPDKLALALDNATRVGAEGRPAAVVPLRKRLYVEDWEVPGLKLRSGSPAKAEEALVHPLRLVDDWLQEPLQGQGIERISQKSPRQQSPSPPPSPRAKEKEKEKAQAAKEAEAKAKQVDKKALAQMSAALQLRQKFVKTTFKSMPAKNRGADSKDRVMMQREYVPVTSQVKLQHR